MKRMVVLAIGLLSTILIQPTLAENRAIERAIDQAKRAIESGDVDPERDLAPLVGALRSAQSVDDQRRLVSRIEWFGRADGDSPAAAKRYLLEEATPLLVSLARSGKDHFLRGDAIMALRSMGAPRAVLEDVAATAEKDSDSYVQSRGEILRNYIRSLPAESAVASIQPKDKGREQKGIAYLKRHNLGVSADQLRQSALKGNSDEVRALLDAGVDVNAGGPSHGALNAAVFSGCGARGGEPEELTATVDALLGAGADVKGKDDNGNTALISAAQMCGPKIVSKLVAAGADVNAVSHSGISPLSIALIMQKLDSAEVLVDKGARLDAKQAQMLSGSATSPRAKEIVARALGK
jgi:Ankyrin repeats (3 copies)